tara:strand:- start:1445 stop:1822 length:378 start_codon:yes stop_codon:yes gene_type:complete
MKNLLWLNDYNLNFDYQDSEKIFIFSKEYLDLISPLRLKIIYQTLCQKQVRIFRGNYHETISTLINEQNFDEIIIPDCPDSKILKTASELKKKYHVTISKSNAVAFREVKSQRFFKFWNLIKNNL